MDRQYLIRDLPAEADKILNVLASVRQQPKWMIVRDALVEYAKRHRKDIATEAKKNGG